MTVDEFLHEYADDDRVELIDGEVYEREASGFTHFTVQNRIKDLFEGAGIRKFGYRCFVEASSRLTLGMAVTPDVSVVRLERLENLQGNVPVTGSPEIAFEVSINDKSSVLERKLIAYLANGARSVCLVYPDSKSIDVYTTATWRHLTSDDTLEFPELLPGLKIPVSAVFTGL